MFITTQISPHPPLRRAVHAHLSAVQSVQNGDEKGLYADAIHADWTHSAVLDAGPGVLHHHTVVHVLVL